MQIAFRSRALAAVMAVSFAAGPAEAQRLPPDAQVIEGFKRVVFGAEITGAFSDSSYLKKFVGPVRFRIESASAIDRTRDVSAFIAEIDRRIAGLEATVVEEGQADFIVHVVDRKDYQRVGREVYGNPFMPVPGNCIARASYSPGGITRSDAIIVSDEGDALFHRCLVEEILQGLGPLNDTAQAPDSVFNDTSRLTEFTRYDRLILNMLYHPRLKPGMGEAEAGPLLPSVLADAKRRLR